MSRYRFHAFLLTVSIVLGALCNPAVGAEQDSQPATIRVMTYNLRYANPGDGDHYWPHRRGAAEMVIKKYHPDLMGIQEGLISQLEDLDKMLPDYARIGIDRSGKGTDEHTAIYYRKDRFNMLENDTLWLSDTPKVPGSKSWGNNLPRILTWGRFEDRKSGRKLVAINVHLDHQSEPSRQESMRMILSLAKEKFAGDPVLLTGDFNSPGTTGAVHAIAVSKEQPGERVFFDAWEQAPKTEGPVGTFHGFNGVPGQARIDWILATSHFKPVVAETVSAKFDDHWPSDHFPVFAEFLWDAKDAE